ncbi:hypothetical protein EK904_006076 [Melospiza melodia maxima]|nr:hypothetical protein EK904_006076 [Melospiza melodia maxima]
MNISICVLCHKTSWSSQLIMILIILFELLQMCAQVIEVHMYMSSVLNFSFPWKSCKISNSSFMQGRKENVIPKILHEVKLENEDLFALPPVCFQCERDLTVHNSH